MSYSNTVSETVGRMRMQTIVCILDNEALDALIERTPAGILDAWARGDLGAYGSWLLGWAALKVLEDTLQERRHGRQAADLANYAGHMQPARCD